MNQVTRLALVQQAYEYEHTRAERERELNDRLLVLLFRLSGPAHSDTGDDGGGSGRDPGVGPVKDDVILPVSQADKIRHYQ